ncbi:unnamed protein product [Gongylonema pulchrum]|uniref:F-box domain-containing protein n=1 Tax=Gongylonema pulchrum TaxID=637853 RepID=A0A183E7Q1_9BILA|nr:unnamed protein product [Gongylonema pulchrum]
MALILPLNIAASVQRCCSCRAGTSRLTDQIIQIIVNRASLFDVIKWQQISKGFRQAAQKRLDAYTVVDIKVYGGLRQLRHKAGAGSEYDWHPSLALMLVELEPNRLGIAIDSELKPRDVTALLRLLFTLRRKVEQLFVDSPVIELLVAQINKEQINMLIEIVGLSRKLSHCQSRCSKKLEVAPRQRTHLPEAPFFPSLKKLSIVSKVTLIHTVQLVPLNLFYCNDE